MNGSWLLLATALSASSNETAGQARPFRNPVLGEMQSGALIWVVEYPNHTGPNRETSQVVFFRADEGGFQLFRRWRPAGKAFEAGALLSNLSPAWFDEGLSRQGDHIFSFIVSTGNLLEYRAATGSLGGELRAAEKADNPSGIRNLLLRKYRQERAFHRLLTDFGLPMVGAIESREGETDLSATTFSGTHATLQTLTRDGTRHESSMTIDGVVMASANYQALNDPEGWRASLISVQLTNIAVGGWTTGLVAKFAPAPRNLPSIATWHAMLYAAATGPDRFTHWDIYSNGVISTVTKGGALVPVSTRKPDSSAFLPKTGVIVVRLCAAGALVFGLAGIIYVLRNKTPG